MEGKKILRGGKFEELQDKKEKQRALGKKG